MAEGDESLLKVLAGLVVGGAVGILVWRVRKRAAVQHRAPPVVAPARRPLARKPMTVPTTSDQTPGLLLRSVQASSYDPVHWAPAPLDDMTIWVATDDLMASPDGSSPSIRLPTSWADAIPIARALTTQLGEDVIVPSQRIVDAARAAARLKTALHPQGTSAMTAVATSVAFSRDIDQQIARLVAAGKGSLGDLVMGHGKAWILHPRLDQDTNDAILRAEGLPLTGPDPAVNYGGWDDGGKLIQTVGGRHNKLHVDYSQLFRPVKRWARKADGTSVDLLAWIEAKEGVPSRYTDLFRPEVALVA